MTQQYTPTASPAPRGRWHLIQDELVRLEFLSRLFSWFFMLLSRLAEPLMLVAILYIVIEAGVPRLAVAVLHETAVAVMISAPEIILPGAFAMAAQSRAAGKPHKLLYTVSWCFVALTGVTLLSLFVFHLDATAFNVVTFLRCGAGVGYSILIRVLSHSQGEAQHVSAPDLLATLDTFTEQVQRTAASTEQSISELSARLTENETTFGASVRSLGETLPTELSARLAEHLQPMSEQVRESAQALAALAALPGLLGHLEQLVLARPHPTEQRGESEQAQRSEHRRLPANTANTPPNVRALPTERTLQRTANTASDKGAFVRSCLAEHPHIRNAEIARAAAAQGMTISPGYISDTRKAFFEEQTTHEEETA